MAWYDRGLDFECKMCSHCCSGEPGNVFVSNESIDRIAKHLSLSREAFLEKYTHLVDQGSYYNISLNEREDFSCVFLTDHGCSIYEVRPLQCKTYPFWPYLLEDRALMEAEKANCPGIGCGQHHSAQEIRNLSHATLVEKLATVVKEND